MAGTDIRILAADHHALFRTALRKFLDTERGMRLVAEAGNAAETIRQVNKHRPDVLLLDLHLTPESGFEVLRRIGSSGPDVRTIILTASIERKEIIKALQLGARGVLLKTVATQLLSKSIRSVMTGELWVDQNSISDLVSALQSAKPASEKSPAVSFGLTVRETEIVSAIVDGYTNKDIAEKLSLSEQTIKHCLTNIFTKLGVPNRLELAIFALDKRLIA